MAPMCFQSPYGMELTKPKPFFITYQRPRDVRYYSSPICSYIWHELKTRVSSKNMERQGQICLLGGTPMSLVPPTGIAFNVWEDPHVFGYPSGMFHYKTRKSNLALPDPRRAAESVKPFCVLDTSVLRKITQKLVNIFQMQHICYLVNKVLASRETFVASSGPEFCEKVAKSEVVTCDRGKMDDKKSVVMSGVSFCSTAVESLHGMKNRLKEVDTEMVNRKQREINKHSKKRKRRMKKRGKNSSYSREKGGTSVKVNHDKPSQVKCGSGHLPRSSAAVGSRTVLHDWEDSDEDLCIVFEDDVDCVSSILPENLNSQCTEIGEITDLWIEFDAFAIVSGDVAVGNSDNTSEILIQCDSDYEKDSGQIEDADDFDSWSGLLFLNDVAVGCSGLQSNVRNPSFVSRSFLYEPPLVNDDVGTCEIHKVNKRWKEMTSDINEGPRLPQRVTFAPEEDLVAVFPADIMDRKSEWEQFAVERFRFKRRVNEFEKIITPYFAPVHREKVCQRMRAADS